MAHCKPCEVCPITDVCIQSVTPLNCPIENYEDSTPKSKNNTKEKQ